MRRFFSSPIPNALAAALVFLALLLKPDRTNPDGKVEDPRPPKGRVCYERIDLGSGATCRFVHDDEAGSEAVLYAMGREQAKVFYGPDTYWFWLRGYDPRRYYFCRPEEAEESRLIPVFRPSFSRWMLNRERDGTIKEKDGPYSVEIESKGGSVVSQRYFLDGLEHTSVLVKAHQSVGGRSMPKIAVIRFHDETVDLSVDMGFVQIGGAFAPDRNPPQGMRGAPMPSALP